MYMRTFLLIQNHSDHFYVLKYQERRLKTYYISICLKYITVLEHALHRFQPFLLWSHTPLAYMCK